jgi:hypothetical protein
MRRENEEKKIPSCDLLTCIMLRRGREECCCMMILLMYLCENILNAEIFMNSFASIFLTVTDHNVQQYGEVNQLGGVFVNVSLLQNFQIELKIKFSHLLHQPGSTTAKWH